MSALACDPFYLIGPAFHPPVDSSMHEKGDSYASLAALATIIRSLKLRKSGLPEKSIDQYTAWATKHTEHKNLAFASQWVHPAARSCVARAGPKAHFR